jgi:hypothetical protein
VKRKTSLWLTFDKRYMSFSDPPWNVPITDLNDNLRAAGVEPAQQDGAQFISELSVEVRTALASALSERVRLARNDAPPVERWMAASQELFMNDDGGEAARQREDLFWQSLTCIVHGCLSLVMLGDLSEFPFFIDLLKHQPAAHLIEMATDVLCRYVDPSHELDAPRLIQRADEWFQTCQALA